MNEQLKPAIFLDRDGVINEDTNYVHKIEDFKILPGVIDALKLLSTKYLLFIVTNQSGIGRKIFTKEQYHILTDHMLSIFEKHQIDILNIYFCEHLPIDDCICRKPNPSSLFHAEENFKVDLKKSFVIGDRWSDIELGKNAGCKTVFIGTEGIDKLKSKPDYFAKDLYSSAKMIINLKE